MAGSAFSSWKLQAPPVIEFCVIWSLVKRNGLLKISGSVAFSFHRSLDWYTKFCKYVWIFCDIYKFVYGYKKEKSVSEKSHKKNNTAHEIINLIYLTTDFTFNHQVYKSTSHINYDSNPDDRK